MKSPKCYLCDTGLAAFLVGWKSWQAVEGHSVAGALWETCVVTEVVKAFSVQGRSIPLWFWRTARGDEVEVIIEKDGRFTAIECKYTEIAPKADLKGLKAFAEAYGQENVRADYVASRAKESYPLTDWITAVPGRLIADHV